MPYRFLFSSILLFCAIGVYTVSNSAAAVLLAALFGVLGYMFMQLDCEPAPLILGFVLGPLMEDNLRRAMRISGGDPMIFLNRPISLGLLIAALVLLALVRCRTIRGGREGVPRRPESVTVSRLREALAPSPRVGDASAGEGRPTSILQRT